MKVMKVEYLKFKNNTNLDDIKSYMYYYRGIGRVAVTVINGEEVYSNDPNLVDVFERLKLGLNEDEYKELNGLERDNLVYEVSIRNANEIENTEYYRFYYGLAKTMIRPDKIDEFENMVNYCGSKFMNELIVITEIMLALEIDNRLVMYKEISNIIIRIKDKKIDFGNVYYIVKNFAIKGDMLDMVFFKDTTMDYRNNLMKKLDFNSKRIDEIKKR